VSGGAPPATVGEDHICSVSEHYATQPGDCFATPSAEEAGVKPRSYRAGATWRAWQGLCLVDGDDRLLAGNGVCELQESRTFRSDCEPTCGDSVLTAEEATTCMHDWLTDRRGCVAGTVDCESQPDCGNGLCEYDDYHQEDACTCPQDCTTPAQYRAIRNLVDDSCMAPPNDPDPGAVCPCNHDDICQHPENIHSCPDDCEAPGTTSSTTVDPTMSSTGDTTDTTDTTDTSTDTSTLPCNEDLICDMEESVDGCPMDCGYCGDGIIFGGEVCDDKNNDDSDDCVECKTAFCGDGHIHVDVETCDDGLQNSNEYGKEPHCNTDCTAFAPHCGDSNPDPEEPCDGDAMAGCIPGACKRPSSCLDFVGKDVPSGVYTIFPSNADAPFPTDGIQVFCDMVADGGGYTFLKVDTSPDGKYANQAEAICATYGMQLWVPRSPPHIKASYALAISNALLPASSDYLSIAGIYQITPGISCIGDAFNSTNCPEWATNDDTPYFVSDQPGKDALAFQPGKVNCSDCSASFSWVAPGAIEQYLAIPSPGASSLRFLCGLPDKLP